MGCGSSAPVSESTKAIEAELKEDKKRMQSELKLLLLGAGESGKSTIAKQMKIIHLDGFDEDELEQFKPIIKSNVIECMKVLVQAAQDMDAPVAGDQSAVAEKYANANAMDMVLDPDMAAEIHELWKDPAIQKAYENRSKFQLPDSASHVLENAVRISQPDYVPATDDILRCRARTTGIHEILFKVNQFHFRMVDVGGQRSERKKWVHCFQDVTAILFVVAMNSYDMRLYEDENVNRMHEAIQLFDEICNSKWFRSTALVLFLNKSDLFKEKIEKVDLKVCFADYAGGRNFANGSAYMQTKFKSLNRQPNKPIYIHITCATDTENVKFVFNSVRDVLLNQSLGASGF